MKLKASTQCSNCGGKHSSLDRGEECRSGRDRRPAVPPTEDQWSNFLSVIGSIPKRVFGPYR